MTEIIEQLESVEKLSRDLREAAKRLTVDEARFLVDAYYSMQEQRIRTNNQIRALGESDEPHAVIDWYARQSDALENYVRSALGVYSAAQPLGEWARSICGIGPVIAAGLLAHIDASKPTVGHVWRFAGLDPTVKWEKGQKRPWNAALKTLCWKIGESFVKVKGRENDVYGKVYEERKERETAMNADGKYADQASAILTTRKIGKTTEAFSHLTGGKLPPGQIHARAKRYAVKLFLSHYHTAGHWLHFKRLAPRPWIVEHGGHAHVIAPPNMELIDGLPEAWVAREGTPG